MSLPIAFHRELQATLIAHKGFDAPAIKNLNNATVRLDQGIFFRHFWIRQDDCNPLGLK